MKRETFMYEGVGSVKIFTYKWSPEKDTKIKGVIQIAHGMSETIARYGRTAESLTEAGFIVYGSDHRAHGQTANEEKKLGYLEEDSFNTMVEDMHRLLEIIKKENDNLPIFLLGHSMGSFLAQRFICLYGRELNGGILSGSNGSIGIMADFGRIVAKIIMSIYGKDQKSTLLDKLTLGGFNKSFKPCKTNFDWLSRNEQEVDKYVKDPYCGYDYNACFYYDLLGGLKLIAKEDEINKIPKDLPIYIFSGDKDPVGKFGLGVLKLVNAYKRAEIEDLVYTLYKDGRHEMLNEKNREEVIKNLIEWLDKHIEKNW